MFASLHNWWWKLLRLAATVLLASTALGAAIAAFYTADEVSEMQNGIRELVLGVSGSNDVALVRRLRAAERAATIDATTNVRVDFLADRATARCAVFLPREALIQLQQTVARMRNAEVIRQLASDYCSVPTIDSTVMTAAAPRFTMGRGASTGEMVIDFHELTYETVRGSGSSTRTLAAVMKPPQVILTTHRVEIELAGRGVRMMARSGQPLLQAPDRLVYRFEKADQLPIDVVVATETPRGGQRRIREVISGFSERYLLVIDPFASGLLYTVPFALFLRLRRRISDETVPHTSALFFASLLLLVLYATLGMFRAAADAVFVARPFFESHLIAACYTMTAETSGAPALAVAMIALTWPRLARAGWPESIPIDGQPRLRGFLRRAIAAWVVVAASAGIYCTGQLERVAMVVIALAATYVCLRAFLAELGVTRRLDAMLMLAVASLWAFIDVVTASTPQVDFVIVALFAIPFLAALARVVARAPRRIPLVLWGAAAAFLIFQPNPPFRAWSAWLIASFAWDLAPMAILATGAAILYILRVLSAKGDWAVLEPEERDTGVVLALLFFFLPLHHWLYIPTAFALGWISLRYWVFAPRPIDPALTDASATILDVIRLNDAVQSMRALKKEMRTKLAKGDVDFDSYTSTIEAFAAKVETLRQRLRPALGAAPAAVLSSGPPMLPWTRAMTGVQFALLFAAPWLVLTLRDFHGGVAPGRGMEWLAAIGTLIRILAQWPLIGFFFGYFYPHLRGNSGVTKGLNLFWAIAVPSFGATALAMPAHAEAWSSFALWALQLFIHCLLIGVFVGDYVTLRASGLGVRQLIDVHNLGAVTAWGSTLLVALGAAIATAASSQVSTLISLALKTMLPETQR